jgi:hypothetical protein
VPNYNTMGLAKASLEASVRFLAQSLGAKGMRVNGISAGPIKTLAASGIKDFGKLLAEFAATTPIRRNVTIDDVGNTAAFLLSTWPAASAPRSSTSTAASATSASPSPAPAEARDRRGRKRRTPGVGASDAHAVDVVAPDGALLVFHQAVHVGVEAREGGVELARERR